MKIQRSFTIDELVLEEAKKYAKREGRPLSNYVNIALEALNRDKALFFEEEDKKPVRPRDGTQVPIQEAKMKTKPLERIRKLRRKR